MRTIDSAQMQRRLNEFDYDVIWSAFAQSLSPGNEQREFWGSEAADRKGSRNYIGIKDPAVDRLSTGSSSPSRAPIWWPRPRRSTACSCGTISSCRCGMFPMSGWHAGIDFGRPEKLPDYSTGFPTIWWWDEERPAKVTNG